MPSLSCIALFLWIFGNVTVLFTIGSSSNVHIRVKRKAVSDENHLWPNGTIYYSVQDAVRDDVHNMAAILSAMHHIEQTTCVKFEEFPLNQTDLFSHTKYALFTKGSGCSSSVGRGAGVGAQNISVGQGCAYRDKMIHELGHLIGLWHEHARSDRDNNVVIMWNNIRPKMRYNFVMMPDMRLLTPYDLSSLMHYNVDTFSQNGDATVQAMDQRLTFLIGSTRELSHYDVLTINNMYKCAASCPASAPACENEGFLTPNCTCHCPRGLGGDRCQTVITTSGTSNSTCHCPRGLGGDRCQTVITTSGCGGVLDVTKPITITSPGYPNKYQQGLRCAWLLKSPPGSVLELRFSRVDIERSPTGACRDRLEVRYHHIGINRGPVYCGDKLPDFIRSTTNKVILHFNTHILSSGNAGFSVNVSIAPKKACRGHPCANGGFCHDIQEVQDYVCICPPGWIGHDCERQVVDGGYSEWSAWAACVSDCGVQDRQRTCSKPTPANGGLRCDGPAYQTRHCGTAQLCQDAFMCGFGTRSESTSCDIYEDGSNDLQWDANFGETPSLRTGPPAGHTTGDEEDAYFYLEASNGRPFDQGIMWVPEREWTLGTYCLQFYYSMWGSRVATLALIRGWTGSNNQTTLWQRSGQQGPGWEEAHVDVLLYNKVKMGFLGVRGAGYESDIAIDDVSVSTGACRGPPPASGCVAPNRSKMLAHGPYIYTHKCMLKKCFCNEDGYLDCPRWLQENICKGSSKKPWLLKSAASAVPQTKTTTILSNTRTRYVLFGSFLKPIFPMRTRRQRKRILTVV